MAASRCGWIMTSLVTSPLPFNCWSRIHTGSKLGHRCVSRWPSTSTVQDISRQRDDYRMGSIFPRFLDFQWIRSVFLLAGLYIVPMAELFSRNLAALRELKRNLKDLVVSRLNLCATRGTHGARWVTCQGHFGGNGVKGQFGKVHVILLSWEIFSVHDPFVTRRCETWLLTWFVWCDTWRLHVSDKLFRNARHHVTGLENRTQLLYGIMDILLLSTVGWSDYSLKL